MERICFVSISAILALSFSIQVQGNAECFKYSFLNESDRAKTFTARPKSPQCDIKMSGWYRFGGDAGHRMADSCVPGFSCGTNRAGWVSGNHPTAADGAVQRKVCFSWANNCCYSSIYISVRNCGGFYVYKLKKPSVCYSRYCGNGLANVLVKPSRSTTASFSSTIQITTTPSMPFQYAPDPFQVNSSSVQTVQSSAVQVKGLETGPLQSPTEVPACRKGFVLGADYKTCEDINECLDYNGGCSHNCTNLDGSYICTCPFGYEVDSSKKNCVDINECLDYNGGCSHNCTNLDGSYICTCPSGYEFDSSKKNCVDAPECPQEKVQGVLWSATLAGRTDIKLCPKGARGTASRKCYNKGTWGNINFMDCSSVEFNMLSDQMKAIVGGSQSELNAQQVLSQLANATEPINNSSVRPPEIYGGDLVIAVDILVQIAKYNGYQGNVSSTEDFENYAVVASNLLDPVNSRAWEELDISRQNSSQILVKAMDDYGMGVTGTLNGSTNSKVTRTKNLMMRIDRLDQDFPSRSKEKGLKIEYSKSSIYLPLQAFSSSQDSRAVTVVYLTLNDVLLLTKERDYEDGQALSAKTTIISTTISPKSPEVLREPVRIVVQNKKTRISSNATSQRKCVFWRPEESATWKTSGCRLVPSQSDITMTTCVCNHLTIFAALMDPYGSTMTDEDEDDKKALEIISIVGCSISLLAVLMTIIAFTLFVRPINTGVKVLVNLCAAIAFTCALVIFEGLARNKAGCPVVAALLHYFLLALFSWMLCEGVVYYIVIVLPFGRDADVEDKMKYFFLFGWGFPAIVVTISLAVTQANGYGSTTACWLDVHGGLIWAFIAPALTVILVNAGVYILVIGRMMKPVTGKVKNKTKVEKLRAGVKASAVLLPLLGITWLFGLLSFNSDTIAFKYIFAIFNSLQGLMIFIFHCAREIKESVRRRLERRSKSILTNPDNRPAPNLKVQAQGGNKLRKVTKKRPRGAGNGDEELQEEKDATALNTLTDQEEIICDAEDAPLKGNNMPQSDE